MTDKYPKSFLATLAITGGAGGVLLVLAYPRVDVPHLVGFIAAAALLEATPVRLRDDIMASLSTVVMFTAIIVGGWPLAVMAALGSGLACGFRQVDRRWQRGWFNFGQFAVSSAVAATAYSSIAGPRHGFGPLLSGRGMLALALAALAATVVNHVLVAVIVRLTRGDALRHTLRGVLGTSLLLQYLYLGFAVVAAVLIVQVHPLTLVLLVVPAMVARRGLLGFQVQEESYDRLVNAFVKVIEVKDPYTRGHADRVATLSEAVAGDLGHDYETRRLVRYAAMLHDVGKIGVPAEIINKPGALDDAERMVINRHPLVGAEMLRDIGFLQPVLDIVRFHHERIDGRGYPYGVPGEDLSPLVRIVTVVDAFDAMTSTRSYRRALDVDAALRELRRHAGTQFDPLVVDSLARMVEQLDWQPTVAFASEAQVPGGPPDGIDVVAPLLGDADVATAGAQT